MARMARPVTATHRLGGIGRQRPSLVALALVTIYLIWGSTYLAIRLAIDTIPPLLMAGIRFLVAGGLLYVWSIGRGEREADRPGRRQWTAALVTGGLLLFGGNGGVSLAEHNVPTGVVALIIALIPMWLALLDRVINRQRLALQAIIGLVLGFGGLVLLIGVPGGERIPLSGALLAVGASLAWATGSLYTRHAPLPRRPLVANGMQMLSGGALLAIVGVAAGELGRLDPARISLHSTLALVYLIVFGSVIAFSAYMWLLRVVPISTVGTYAYVNPVVAVFLGWLLLDEALDARILIAGAVIVVAVAMIITARKLPPGDAADGVPDAASVMKEDGT
jgi:drug/metabolite transporter (DMT)-like permease